MDHYATLTCMYRLDDNALALAEACKRDLGKGAFEAYISEVDWCKNDILFVCKNLAKWMKDESAPVSGISILT